MRKRNARIEIPQNTSQIFSEICSEFNADNSFLLKRIPLIRLWIMEDASTVDLGHGLSLDFTFISEKHRLLGDKSREITLSFDKEEVNIILDEETDCPIEKTWKYTEVDSIEQMMCKIAVWIEHNL